MTSTLLRLPSWTRVPRLLRGVPRKLHHRISVQIESQTGHIASVARVGIHFVFVCLMLLVSQHSDLSPNPKQILALSRRRLRVGRLGRRVCQDDVATHCQDAWNLVLWCFRQQVIFISSGFNFIQGSLLL